MEKKMTLVDLVFMGMGGCIGAGIYSMLGVGVGYTGRSVALAFLIAMLFKMSQNVRTIVTSSMFSMSGGMYSQTALVLTPLLTGVNALMAIVGSFTFAVFGLSLASYTVILVPALIFLKQRVQAKVERNESLYITALSDISNCRTPQNKPTLRIHAKALP